jgi:hypothetical protein
MTDALGIVRDYDDLRALLRRMAEVRNISRKEIDRLAGWPDGLAEKALAECPLRRLGPTTIGGGLGALGVMLIAVEDPEAMAKFTARAMQRDANQARVLSGGGHDHVEIKLSRRKLKRLSRLGAKKRNENMTPKQRSKSARHAANARWKRKRQARRARNAARRAAALLAPCQDTKPID